MHRHRASTLPAAAPVVALAGVFLVVGGWALSAQAESISATLQYSPEAVYAAWRDEGNSAAQGGFQLESPSSLPEKITWFVVPPGHRVIDVRTQVLSQRVLKNIPVTVSNIASDDRQTQPLVRVVGYAAWLGWQIVSVAVAPVQWRGEDLQLATQLSVVLETQPGGIEPLQRQRRNLRRRQRDAEDVRRYVTNGADVEPFAPAVGKAVSRQGAFLPSAYPDLEGSDVEYLILTPASLMASFQALADWKTRRGVPTVVRSIESVVAQTRQGSDLQETLRNYLQDAYSNWSLEYVLLGGDTDLIPARYLSSTFGLSQPEEIPCDLYFAGLDGNWNADGDGVWGEAGLTSTAPDTDQADLLAEVHVSRATVLTTADVDLFVQKVIAYETPLETTYQDTPLFLAEVLFPTNYDGSQTITTDGAQLTEDLIAGQFPPGTPTRRRYESYTQYPGSLDLTVSLSLQDLAAGYNLVNHMGHGFRYNMSVGDGSIVNNDASALLNGNKLSIVNVLNCTSLAFDFECLAEAYLGNPNGGAVAVLGAARSAYPMPSREYQKEFYNLLFNQNESKLGRLFSFSRLPLTPLASYETAHRWTHYIYNILGDPEMEVFCALPEAIQVTHVGTASLGDNSITITVADAQAVPVAGAKVCLLKDADDYVVGLTDANGSVTLDFRAESAGNIDVTVSGRNLQTYLGNVVVAGGGPAYVNLDSYSIDDGVAAGTIGNSDLLIDAGETIDLLLTLRNDGGAVADTVSGTFSITDPYVSVVSSSFTAFGLAPGGSAVALAPVRLQVLPQAPDGHVFEMVLTTSGGGSNWEDRVRARVRAPMMEIVGLQYLDQQLGNGNGIPDEGETFDLVVQVKNFGSGAIDGVTALLQSTQQFAVQVLQASASYGSIASFAVGQNTGSFQLTTNFVDATTVNLRLTDGYGRLVVLPLDMLRPSSPAAAPGLDPTTGPTTMLLTWPPVTDTDLLGYHVYRAESSGGPWLRVTTDPTPVSYFRDTGLQTSTKYWYYTAAIDTGGNVSANSATSAVSTNPPQLAGWPIAMQQETSSSPALGDLDGDGVLEVVQGNSKVYAWHSVDGLEILDADANAQTWGVFLNESATTTASVALGELDGTAGLEVVSCNWDDNTIFVTDGDGTLLWTAKPNNGGPAGYWSTPTIADVDRDGQNEVLAVSKDGRLYAWNSDGTPLLPGNPDGTFAMTAAWSRSSPAVGNLDQDFELEIVVTDVTGVLHAWNPDGTVLPGFPLSWGFAFYSSPVLGDVDGDGDLEIIAFSETGFDNLHVLNADGSELNGWPKTVASESPSVTPSPALADLDGDGKLEIIVASNEIVASTSSLHVYHWDGTPMSGWPKSTGADTESSPVVADLDGDGSPDILLGGQNGVLNAWSAAGTELVGFPLSVGDFIRATPSIGDVDGDGDVDIAFSGWDRTVYIWDLPAAWDPALAWWPTYLHDASRTGRWDATTDDATDVGDSPVIAAPPRKLELAQNHPNPFNPSTTIAFGIPGSRDQPVQLRIFDVRGRMVRQLLDRPLAPGQHEVVWDGRNDNGAGLGSGVYFYRLAWQDEVLTRRLVLMK